MTAQAIAGVSPTSESRIMTEFPSVASTGIGRLIGQIMGCIPIRIFGVKLSSLLFGLPLAPLGMLLFLWNRPFGERYILTNRSVQVWASLGTRRIAVVDLNEIADVELDELPGQKFFRAADICLKASNGKMILRLSGVCDAGAFRNAIQRTMQSRRMVQSSLATIAARKQK